MKYKQLEQEIDLNDPESGFSFSSDGDSVELSFVDWRNRKLTFRFYTTYVFTYRIANGWKSLPAAHVLEILDSVLIKELRKDHREDYLKPLAVSVTDMALKLGVSRKTISKIINEKGAVTPDMALRLSRAFGTSAELWLNLQKNYDLWQAEHSSNDWQRVHPFPKRVLHPEL